MKTSDLDYCLPENLIARYPSERREDSRLLRVRRDTGAISHHIFRDFPKFLRPGDLLILNNTRVFPARLLGRRYPDGGKLEALLLKIAGPDLWWAMVKPGKRVRLGDRLVFAPQQLEAVVEAYGPQGGGERLLRFHYLGDWWDILERVGHTPLPPYILRARKQAGQVQCLGQPKSIETDQDKDRYQTVYAGSERASVAAPTAGLHFTSPLLRELEQRGIQRGFLQLHVGPGTFLPIKSERVEEHPMHEEYFRLPPETALLLNAAIQDQRRIVAVGTTVVRALETAVLVRDKTPPDFIRLEQAQTAEKTASREQPFSACSGWTRLMICPGFVFRAVNALLTNFHLPRSTLLLLIDAFAGVSLRKRVYEEAIHHQYRFYSYGDCMLIE